METKWQYIARRCRGRGFLTSARLATSIDKLIRNLGYPDNTCAWEEAWASAANERTIYQVATQWRWCTPCDVKHHENALTGEHDYCATCRFSHAGGTQLYREFHRMLMEEKRQFMKA